MRPVAQGLADHGGGDSGGSGSRGRVRRGGKRGRERGACAAMQA
jgi:hypothetical protein